MEAENKKRLQDLAKAIQDFIGTSVHVSFVGSTKRDLDSVEENILDLDYCSPISALEASNLSGQRKVLLANLTLFEDTVDNLNSRIEAILDEDNQNPLNTNVDEEI